MPTIKGTPPVQPNLSRTTTQRPGESAGMPTPAKAPAMPALESLQGLTQPVGFGQERNTHIAPSSGGGVSPIALRLDSSARPDKPKAFRFAKHSGPEITFPLTSGQAAKLRNCNAVSPVVPSDPQVLVQPDFLPKPTHPGDPGFWSEFEQVIDLQVARRGGGQVSDMLDTPKVFEGYSMTQGAEAVRSDFPNKWPTTLAEQFLKEGAKVDASIVPQRSQADFVNGPVLLARTIGWAVSEVSPSAFACKWNEGRARPESVAWAVHTGELDAPPHIQKKVAQMSLSKAEDFTAYGEGAPNHPSWPAMHSAASSSSLYMAVVMDLSPQQIAEARRMDYAVATFRSAAGVHYDTDNRAGLALGQEVVARQLPEFLAQYGADPDAVRAKIERVRHDWYAYESKQAQP
jgi:hypothetical protein